MESRDVSSKEAGVSDPRSSLLQDTSSSVVDISRYDMDRLTSWIRMATLRKQLHEIENVVNVIPCSSGLFKPKESTANRDKMDWGTIAFPQREVNLNSVKIPTESLNVPNDRTLPKHEAPPKCEYFSGASKRRIAAAIKKGVSAQTARNRERERRKNLRDNVYKRMHSNECTSIDTPLKKSKSITKGLTEDRMRQSSEPSSPDEDVKMKPKVFIRHAKHPEITLQDEDMKKIQYAILDEMDKLEDAELHPQFLASAKKTGGMSITCNNKESRDWIQRVLAKSMPELIVLEEDITSHACIAYIPTEDNMSKETFLMRVGRQNPGLSTESWRVVRMNRGKTGGIIAIFYVDDASKTYIEEQRFRLFLNLFQIRVDIRRKDYFITALDDEAIRMHRSQWIPKPISENTVKPIEPSGAGDRSSLGVIIAQCLSNMHVHEEKTATTIVPKRRSRKKSRTPKVTGDPSAASISDN